MILLSGGLFGALEEEFVGDVVCAVGDCVPSVADTHAVEQGVDGEVIEDYFEELRREGG